MRTFAVIALALLLLCGCAAKPPAQPQSPLAGHSGSYEAEANIEMPGLTATATISQSPEVCQIAFTAPDTLAGMEYRFDGDSVDLSYRGLQFQFDPQAVPDGAAASILCRAVERALKDDTVLLEQAPEGALLSGMLDAGAFTLLVDAGAGTPSKLLLPDRDLVIEFANFRFLD